MNDHESGSGASKGDVGVSPPVAPTPGAVSHDVRVARLLASPRVTERRPPRSVDWPIPHHAEPQDVAAFYRACDGLVLDDGTVLCGKGELHDLTQWVVLDRGMRWPDDFVVVGERSDAIIVLDLDVRAERAGGGVLEVVTDHLEALDRVASDLVAYAMMRARVKDDSGVPSPPETGARAALADGNADLLDSELRRAFYPGSDRLVATLALGLGRLRAAQGDTGAAMRAFELGVEASARCVGPEARTKERRATWLSAARTLKGVPAKDVQTPPLVAELVKECEVRAERESGAR